MFTKEFSAVILFFLFSVCVCAQDDYPISQFFIKSISDSVVVRMKYQEFRMYFDKEKTGYIKMNGAVPFRQEQPYFSAYAQLLDRRDSLSAILFETIAPYKITALQHDFISFKNKYNHFLTDRDEFEYSLFFSEECIDSLKKAPWNVCFVYKYNSQNVITEREIMINGTLTTKTKYYYLGNEALLLVNYIRCEDVNLYKLDELIVLYRTPKRVPEKKKLKMLLKQFDIDISKERQCHEW